MMKTLFNVNCHSQPNVFKIKIVKDSDLIRSFCCYTCMVQGVLMARGDLDYIRKKGAWTTRRFIFRNFSDVFSLLVGTGPWAMAVRIWIDQSFLAEVLCGL